jgi:hypothetical protein
MLVTSSVPSFLSSNHPQKMRRMFSHYNHYATSHLTSSRLDPYIVHCAVFSKAQTRVFSLQ